MNRDKLVAARRDVERLRMAAAGADESAVAIWDAGNRVADLERKERESTVRAARTAGRVMDVVLLVVALLTMGFSLGNIHAFAATHGIDDPIAWFVAPAVDLALLAALMGDAVLSRWQLSAGRWATALRWYAGAATLTLNTWESVASVDVAGIVLHASMPILLFVLAEAASPYRFRFAETVQLAASATVDTAPAAEVDTVPPVLVDSPAPADPVIEADTVYDQDADPAVSTMTPQEAAPAATWESETRKQVDWLFGDGSEPMPTRTVDATDTLIPADGRLDADAAKSAIEQAWTEGLTVREAAARATRSSSYVGGIYKRLERERGPQPSKGQTAIGMEAA